MKLMVNYNLQYAFDVSGFQNYWGKSTLLVRILSLSIDIVFLPTNNTSLAWPVYYKTAATFSRNLEINKPCCMKTRLNVLANAVSVS